MKYLKLFESFDDFLKEDLQDVKNAFQEIVDEWELFDRKTGYQGRCESPQDTKIEYEFIIYTDNLLPVKLLQYKFANKVLFRDENLYIGIFIDLTGPNDFYTTRLRFLDDLEPFIKRVNDMGFKCELLHERHNSNVFFIYIKKPKE